MQHDKFGVTNTKMSASVKLIPSAKMSFAKTSPTQPSIPKSGLLPTPTASDFKGTRPKKDGITDLLTLLPEDSLASRFPSQENGWAQQTTAISGQKCLGSYESFNRHGSSLRMLVASLLGTTAWYSNRCVLIWKRRTMKYNRLLFQLVPRTLHIAGTESGLLQTFQTKIVLLPTPDAYEGLRGGPRQYNPKGKSQSSRTVSALVGSGTGKKLRLQPAFPEWMMGFPEGWCDFPMELVLPKPNGEKRQSKPTVMP